MKDSTTSRYFKGKKFPGLKAPVSAIKVWGERRIITSEKLEKISTTKQALLAEMERRLREEGRIKAAKTLRQKKEGWAVKIGGLKKGKLKVFKTKGAAKAAITRAYGKN